MPVHKERRWAIRNRVTYWAQQIGVHPKLVRVQRMTRKWGSCSTSGVITLAIDLADQEAGFQDFVIAHELLHLRVPNHGKLFKALMTVHVPDWKKYHVKKRSAADASNPPGQQGASKNAMEGIFRGSNNNSEYPFPYGEYR